MPLVEDTFVNKRLLEKAKREQHTDHLKDIFASMYNITIDEQV